ncbi:MAG: FliH/SctL family protein [Desulfovibrionaceae bacterium]|nr:FliH/SctL family protein [Desulfovibrionaceae bacterium]
MPEAIMKQESSRSWGRIFMDSRETRLGEVEWARSQNWTEKDESLYLDRVRRKAEERAREVLAAAAAEASVLRAAALEEGYAEGLKKAEREMEELRASMGESTRVVLEAIQERASRLFGEWREDLVALLRLAVEQGIGTVLREDRAEVLENIFVRAVQNLEESRSVIVRCNPEDAAVVEDIIGLSRSKCPSLSAWQVRPDQEAAPGDIMVESESSMAGSSQESRLAAVRKALEGLELPE